MSKEYIEREAAIFDLEIYEKQVIKDEYALAIAGCRSHIRNIHAADVVEVRHGLNNNTEYADCDQFVCSECGIELQDWRRVERDCDDGEEYYSDYIFRFCPHCGAKMDGGVNDGKTD